MVFWGVGDPYPSEKCLRIAHPHGVIPKAVASVPVGDLVRFWLRRVREGSLTGGGGGPQRFYDTMGVCNPEALFGGIGVPSPPN